MLFILVLSVLCMPNFIASEEVDPLVIRIKECSEETETPKDLVDKSWETGSLSDIESIKDFYLCYAKKGGFLSSGKYQPKVMKEALMGRLEIIADRIVAECTKKIWPTDTEMAVNFVKCYHDQAPYGYDFKEKLEI